MDETSRDKGKRAAGNPAREPRTIDLAPSEIVEETAPVASHAAGAKAGDDTKAAHEPTPPRGSVDEPASQDRARSRRRPLRAWLPALPPSVASAALGGLVGALVVLAGWWLLTPRDKIVTRVTKLERALDRGLLETARRADVETLDNRLSEVAAALKAANDRLATVSSKADDTARRLATAPASSQPGGPAVAAADIAEIRQRLDALEATLKGFDPGAARVARESADKSAALAASLDSRVGGLEKSGGAPPVSRGVVTLMLQRAVESGKPYQAELAAMKAAGADQAALAPLERFAGSGLPSVNSLTRDFGQLANRILADAGPAADEGWLDRLARSAQRVVRIRPADEQAGASPGAVVARIEAALKRRDLPAAAAAWDALPDAGRQASREWGERLKGRVATEAALQKLVGDELASLTRQETPVR
jgi:hypothetical protein